MDAVTYPDDAVEQFLSKEVVCFKPQIDENKDLARRYGVVWTPGLLWLDAEGSSHHQNVGFFPPEEFLAECAFGMGKVAAGCGDWSRALEHFDRVAETWPGSHAAPAALYWAGVASKMDSGKLEGLMERWKQILSSHPRSAWAMKVSFLE